MWKDDDPGVEWWPGLEVEVAVAVAMDEEKSKSDEMHGWGV